MAVKRRYLQVHNAARGVPGVQIHGIYTYEKLLKSSLRGNIKTHNYLIVKSKCPVE